MDFSALIIKMVIFAVLLATGYFLAGKKILGPEFNRGASSLLINVFISASIINSVIGGRPDIDDGFSTFLIAALSIVITYSGAFIFWLFVRKEKNAAQTEMMLDATNTLFVGIPVVQSLYGSEAVFYVGMSCIPYNVLLYSYIAWKMKKEQGGGSFSFRNLISVPLISAVIALLIFILNPPVPRLVSDLISTVSAATVPVSMIVIGSSLGKVNPAKAFTELRNYTISLERLVIMPIVTYFVTRCLTDNTVLILTCTVIAGVPIGAVATPLSIENGYDAEYCAKATMVTTVLCMITIPVLLKILFG